MSGGPEGANGHGRGLEAVSDYPNTVQGEFGENKSTLPLKTVAEIISEAGEGPPWLIDDLVARGGLTDCAGLAKKGGKTTFWLHGIGASARGEDHAGFATAPGTRYIYLTEQGNNFADALREAGLEECPENIRIVQFKDVSAVGWERLVQEAGAETERLGFDVLVVDTFAVFARLKGLEENDSGAVGDKMRVLRLVAQRHDIGVVLIRHSGKDGTPRGSSAFEAEADICVSISRPEGRHDPRVRKLSGIGRYGEWERNVQLVDGRYVSLGTDNKVEFGKAVRFIKAVLPESPDSGMKQREIREKRTGPEEDIAARTLSRALDWLVKQKDVGEKQLMDQRGKPKVYWLAYKPPGDDPGVYSRQTPPLINGNGENQSGGLPEPPVEGGDSPSEEDRGSAKEAVPSHVFTDAVPTENADDEDAPKSPEAKLPEGASERTLPPETEAQTSKVAEAILLLFEEYPGLKHERDPGELRKRLARFGQPRDRFAKTEEISRALIELFGAEERIVSDIETALKGYLDKNPSARGQQPSLIANILWSEELVAWKPSAHEISAALEGTGGEL
jgi:hypothetical protein